MSEMLTLAEQSANQIRHLVLKGDFKPGQTISQRQMSRTLGVSPIVIRDCLHILETEGIVENIPKWGTRVPPLDAKRLRGQYLVREALEGMAARIAAERITSPDVERLKAMADAIDDLFYTSGTDIEKLAATHYRFHAAIGRLSACKEIITQLKRVNLQQVIWATSRSANMNAVAQPRNWHRQLVEAIASGDPDRAERVMREHVRDGYKCVSLLVADGDENEDLPF